MNDVPKTIEAVWKIGATRLVTAIARVTHNIRIAEELAQEARSLRSRSGSRRHPRKSRAWLMNLKERKLRAKRLKQI